VNDSSAPAASASADDKKPAADKPRRAADATVYCKFAANAGVSEQGLRTTFAGFGTIVGVKCFEQKGYAFVDLESSEAAEKACSGGSLKCGTVVMQVNVKAKAEDALKGRPQRTGPRPERTERTDRTERTERTDRPKFGKDGNQNQTQNHSQQQSEKKV
jgi:hypothetical protein